MSNEETKQRIEQLQAQVKKYLRLYEDEHEAANKMAYQIANILAFVKDYEPTYAVEQIRKMLEGEEQP